MLTKDDIRAIKSLLDPLESRLGNRISKVERSLESHKMTSQKEHRRLQASINRLVDDLGEDVYVLKEKMQRVETHPGFSAI